MKRPPGILPKTLLGLLLCVATVSGCGGGAGDPGATTDEAQRYEVYQRMLPPGEAAQSVAWDGQGSEDAQATESSSGVLTVDRVDVKAVRAAGPEEDDVVWPVTVEPGSRLRFGILPGDADPGATPTVTVVFREAGGRAAEVFRRTETWGAEQAGPRWIEVPLQEVSGAGELVFETGDGGPDALRPWWLNPVLLRPESTPRPNVVVICIDTLRADRVGGDAAEVPTPNLSRRMATGTVFEEAYVNSSWSLPSMATILTGLYPGQHNAGRRAMVGESAAAVDYNARAVEGGIELTIGHNVYRYQMLHPEIPTLQELLGRSGYLTGAVHNNGYISYPTRVLKDFDYVQHYRERDAAVGTARALEWIDANQDARFFLFLHYIDPHQWPRHIPEELQGQSLAELDQEERATILETYDSLVRYTDVHLEEFFQGLEERGLGEDTVFVALADHGERFFEKGVTGSHGGSFLETVIQVPLGFWGPSIPAARVAERTHLVDVVPTLLDLVGTPATTRFQGRSLEGLMSGERRGFEGRDVISEFVLWGEEQAALLDGRWKYVYYPESQRGELYDIADHSEELMDRSKEQPEVAASLHEQLTSYLASSARRFAALEYGETAADEKMLESLRALGYID